jgi:soluble lytic murein transglycosylase-like protein
LQDLFGLRGEERRHEDRRRFDRGTPERRRADRRRRTMRGLLLGMFTLSFPGSHALHKATTAETLQGTVSVSEDYRAVPATLAYNDAIAEAADLNDLDPNLIRAVIHAESAFNPFAVSRVGAQGLMQLMPALAEEMNVLDPFDPRQNIFGGAKYLRSLLDRYNGNVELAVAAYNAGPGAVSRYRGIPPYRETRNYVKTVTTFLKNARRADAD